MGIYLAKLDLGTHPVLDTAAHARRIIRVSGDPRLFFFPLPQGGVCTT